jgi:hypothetical protein
MSPKSRRNWVAQNATFLTAHLRYTADGVRISLKGAVLGAVACFLLTCHRREAQNIPSFDLENKNA